MHKYTPGEWHDCADKRALSLLDKHTLLSKDNAALIMPGEPGTEFEELIDAGYQHSKIRCVDNTNDPFHRNVLKNYYGDQFYNSDVFKYIKSSSEEFSYMHFDMCCMSDGDTHKRMLEASSKLSGVSRLRYSGSRTIRGVAAKARMNEILENYQGLRSYCLKKADNSSDPSFWLRAAEECNSSEDEPGGILAGIFCGLKERPISNIYKKIYLGKHQSSHMFTFWIDFDSSLNQNEENEMQIVDTIVSDSKKWRQQ